MCSAETRTQRKAFKGPSGLREWLSMKISKKKKKIWDKSLEGESKPSLNTLFFFFKKKKKKKKEEKASR
jgi:hypothetical protein